MEVQNIDRIAKTKLILLLMLLVVLLAFNMTLLVNIWTYLESVNKWLLIVVLQLDAIVSMSIVLTTMYFVIKIIGKREPDALQDL